MNYLSCKWCNFQPASKTLDDSVHVRMVMERNILTFSDDKDTHRYMFVFCHLDISYWRCFGLNTAKYHQIKRIHYMKTLTYVLCLSLLWLDLKTEHASSPTSLLWSLFVWWTRSSRFFFAVSVGVVLLKVATANWNTFSIHWHICNKSCVHKK